jgi:hypothetical protein
MGDEISGIIGSDEELEFLPLPGDSDAFAGHAMPDL